MNNIARTSHRNSSSRRATDYLLSGGNTSHVLSLKMGRELRLARQINSLCNEHLRNLLKLSSIDGIDVGDTVPAIAHLLPLLKPLFPKVADQGLIDTGVAISLLDAMCRQVDHITDIGPSVIRLHFSHLIHIRAISLLTALVPANKLPSLLQKLEATLVLSSIAERQLVDRATQTKHYDDDELLSSQKNAIVMFAVDILCALSDFKIEDRSEAIEALLRFCSVIQRLDDLFDWREDFRSARYSPVLRQLNLTRLTTEEEIAVDLYCNGIALRCIEHSIFDLKLVSNVISKGTSELFEHAYLRLESMSNVLKQVDGATPSKDIELRLRALAPTAFVYTI